MQILDIALVLPQPVLIVNTPQFRAGRAFLG